MIEYTLNDFEIDKLGSFYTKKKTTFRVFAPYHNTLFLILDGISYQMHKDNFIHYIEIKGNLEKCHYHFESDKGIVFNDPFAYLADEESIILDKSKFIKDIYKPAPYKDMIIYEASVRDFSSDKSFLGKYHKKFLAFTQGNLKKDDYFVLGLDYLVNLGISHLQLLPVFAYDNDHSEYNWGYNPLAFNYVNKDYVYDIDNYYAYINELRMLVNTLHQKDIRVVLDVVFNHVYDANRCDLQKMLSGNFLRTKQDGTLAQGTMCGNEIKSEDVFTRQYLIEMSKRYVELFDIDGIRLDLMGIMDIDTINLLYNNLIELKDDFVLYGEGWNMGDVLDESMRASIKNAFRIPKVSMFNDLYRDTIIDYVNGNHLNGNIAMMLAGHHQYLNYLQSINYVECHDGYTMYDLFNKDGIDQQTLTRKCKLALALVLVSRGASFIHAGQEFKRTKNGIRNSYNMPDEINKLDWNLRILNNDMCDYFKDLIKIRKEYDVFSKNDTNIYTYNYYDCLVYQLDYIKVIINPTDYDSIYNNGFNHQMIFDLKGKCDYCTVDITIPAHSLIICKS